MTSHAIDIQDCLAQMSTEDPTGSQAEALLRRLTIFEGTFDSNAAAALAPAGMTEADTMSALVTLQQWGLLGRVAVSEPLPIDDHVLEAIPSRAEAFATLQAWGFLERETVPTRYFLLKSVIRALPPHEDAAERHYNYYHKLYNNSNANSHTDHYSAITLDWPDIHAALVWGLIQKPKSAIEFAWALQLYIRDCLPADQQQSLLQSILSAAEQRHDLLNQGHALTSLAVLAQHEGDLAAAHALYQAALTLYEQDNSWAKPIVNTKLLYDLFALQHTLDTAQDLSIHMIRHDNLGLVSQVLLLFHLHDLLMRQEHFEEALNVMLEMFGLYEKLQNERGQCDTLTNLGQTAFRSGDIESARDYFAWALRMGERLSYTPGQIKTLWTWGQAEYKAGNTKAGCALCWQGVMVGTSEYSVYYDRVDALRRQLEAMKGGEF